MNARDVRAQREFPQSSIVKTGEMSESSSYALQRLEWEVFRPEHGWGFIENPAPGMRK